MIKRKYTIYGSFINSIVKKNYLKLYYLNNTINLVELNSIYLILNSKT